MADLTAATCVAIARRRMQALRLEGDPFERPGDVVRWLTAVQSQDYGPAKWSIGQRARGLRDADVEDAFQAGTILRTHVLRPTWHFVLPADVRWLLDVTGHRVLARNAPMYPRLELDGQVLEQCSTVITEALRGGTHLTRREIQAVLGRHGIVATGQRLAYIMMHAELTGVICSGALKGKQHTYGLLDERAPAATWPTGDDALAELTHRYFTSHGPATAQDLRGWASLTLAAVRRGIELVSSRLERELLDGTTFWWAAADSAPDPTAPAVHLLQGYDEYIMGYSESKYVLDIFGVGRLGFQDRASFNAVVILDGQVAGMWRRTPRKDGLLIQVALHVTFNAAQTRALHLAADKHAAFLGLNAVVEVI